MKKVEVLKQSVFWFQCFLFLLQWRTCVTQDTVTSVGCGSSVNHTQPHTLAMPPVVRGNTDFEPERAVKRCSLSKGCLALIRFDWQQPGSMSKKTQKHNCHQILTQILLSYWHTDVCESTLSPADTCPPQSSERSEGKTAILCKITITVVTQTEDVYVASMTQSRQLV